MIWLRKGFVHLLSIVLLVCLLGMVTSLGLNRSLAHPDKLESWLVSSKIYDHLVTAELDQAQKSSSDNGDSGSVSLSDPDVRQAAETAFSPAVLENSVNTFLAGNYAWLEGKTATPSFTIDLTSAKQNFADLVGQAAETHLAALPVCTPTQLAQLQIPVDTLSVTCRPPTLDPKIEAASVAQEVDNSSDIISNPVITASSLSQDNIGQEQTNGQSSPGQPYYQRFSKAPKVYKAITKLPLILGGIVLVSGLGIVFIAPERRRGVRRIGVVLAEAGIILLVEKFTADAVVNKLQGKIVKGSNVTGQLKQPFSTLLHQIESQLVSVDLWFGIAFLVIALVIFITLFRTRQKNGKPKPPKIPKGGVSDTPVANPQDIQLAPPTDIRDRVKKPEGPRPTTAPPLGKNPPRPKRPRLIQ